MRTLLTAIALLGGAGIASSAPALQYTFSFTVQIDNASPVALHASVAPGASQTIQATQHLRVEIEAPASVDDTSTTVVKLIDDSSGKPVVLHTSRREGPIGLVRSFGYAVCGGETTFQSPLQGEELGCKKQSP
jgi:hypothetical protein